MRWNRLVFVMLSMALGLLMVRAIPVTAQEGTPAASNCPVTSVEENIALVQQLYAAVASGDGPTIDAILADDYVGNAERFGLPNDPTSNADEIQLAMMLMQVYPSSTDVVREIFGADNKVVVETVRTISQQSFSGTPVAVDPPIEFRTIGILTIECGQIVSLDATANTLELLVGLGIITLPEMGPAATPAA